MKNIQSLQSVNLLLKQNKIEIACFYFSYIYGKIEIISVAADCNNFNHVNIKHNKNHPTHSSECILCATVKFLHFIFANIDDFYISSNEIRFGRIILMPTNDNIEDRYLIALSTDIQSEPIKSVFLKRDKKLMLN